jgi:hypothetical protein
VEDGFDPKVDKALAGRTVDWYLAGASREVVASGAKVEGDRVVWSFGEDEGGTMSASLELAAGKGEPVLRFRYVPKSAGWYSVVYAGAPAVAREGAEEIFQSLIWTEKRVPNRAYLTEAYRCTVPATLVRTGGVTSGVVVEPGYLPFQPMPTLANSKFGMSVVNEKGEVQSVVAAPILGGAGSKLGAGEGTELAVRLLVREGTIDGAYEYIAREVFGFRDVRHNVVGSLNTTLENTIDYAMSEWARFNSELRGSAYDTDVPGSVKNISSLHPLGAALVTDDEAIYTERARPMMEYAASRERFLFTTDPTVKGQGASAKLNGPGVPLTEMTALYEMSHRRSPVFLKLAQQVWGKKRSLNLDADLVGDSWQNALAMYRATGEKSWLEKAVMGADKYVEKRVKTTQTDYSDPESRGMFFWTSYAPNWMELSDLYDATGEKRFLEAAREGARDFARFVYLCPAIPDGTVTVDEGGFAPRYRGGTKLKPIPVQPETVEAWQVSEMGLTCEGSATSKGHRGILLTSFAPWMLRLAEATGDSFLHDIGRSAVIGRYRSFPGYHMNTARTTVYQKVDFARRPMDELNSTTSLHYNHIWAQVAMEIDYLVSDVEARSKGAVAFPGAYAEGYAYVQSRVYGHAAGSVYGEGDVWLWMPRGVMKVEDQELNYVVMRGPRGVYVAFANQSDREVESRFVMNEGLVTMPGEVKARVWRENKPGGEIAVSKGGGVVKVAPKGLTVVALDGAAAGGRGGGVEGCVRADGAGEHDGDGGGFWG